MALTWTATLKDDVSAPASKAAGGLDAMGAAAKKTDSDLAAATKEADAFAKALQKVSDAAVKEAKDQAKVSAETEKYFKDNEIGAKTLKQGTDTSGESLTSATTKGNLYSSALMGIAGAAKEAIVYLEKLSIGLAETVFDGNKQKEDAIKGFESVTGSAEQAKLVYNEAAKTSMQVGGDLHETMSEMNNLLSHGFKADVADNIIKAMADIKVMDPAADVSAIGDALDKVHSQGGLAEKTIKSIALAAHTTVPDIESALESNLHKSKGEIDAMLKKGTISADEGTKAVLDAISKKTGKPLGELAQDKAENSLDGVIARAKNLKDQMVANAKVDWSPLISTIQKVTDAMSSEDGKKFMKSAVDGIDEVVTAIGKIDAKDISTMFSVAGTAIRAVSEIMTNQIMIAEGIVVVVGDVGDAISSAWKAGETFFNGIGSWFEGGKSTASSGGSEIGGAIIDGIIQGIESKAGDAISAIVKVGGDIVSGGKGAVHSNSPSKDFHDIGEDISKGEELGIIKGTPMVHKAVMAMVDVSHAQGQAAEQKPLISTGSREAFKAGQSMKSNVSNSNRQFTGNVVQHFHGSEPDASHKMEDALRSLNNSFG